MDPRIDLLDDDDDLTEIDVLPAPMLHIPPPARPKEATLRAPIPPPLPIPLTRRVEQVAPLSDSDEAWLATLPPASRNVLEAARRTAGGWPTAPRIASAIAQPIERRRSFESR